MDIYPLIFEPQLKYRVWGGHRLAGLGKQIPQAGRIGESWEVSDLDEAQSVVANGPEKGRTSREMMQRWGSDLTGRANLVDRRFPLLIKFLDAAEPLSVQVHPKPSTNPAGAPVKHEAWYVVDADPDACIYRGVRPGVDRDQLREAIFAGRLPALLNRVPAKRGHCYYLPSGTVHALGGGVLVAEVQTPSDVTYRLFDWNRVEPATGLPRTLHIEEALDNATFESLDPTFEQQQHLASVWTTVTSLVRCDAFAIERVRMVQGVEQEIPYEEMVIWIVLEGSGSIACDGLKEPVEFRAGDTVVLPAALKKGQVRTKERCMWLEVSVPVASSLSGFDRPSREGPHAEPKGDGFVPLTISSPATEKKK